MRPAEKGPRRFRLHRGRLHRPRPPADPECPLRPWEITQLATYNAETQRGLVHDAYWQARMAGLQRQYDRWRRDCTDRYNRWSLENTPNLSEANRKAIMESLGIAS